jgi:hypothetical protein
MNDAMTSTARADALEHKMMEEMIGIGGRLAAPPLPHHRAYGSRTAAVRRG